MSSGKFVAAMGIPSCGKSSIIRELAKHFGEKAVSFFEPEENDTCHPWPLAVSQRQEYGYLGSITWFRSMRVPQLFQAQAEARNGKMAFVDSYYDKLFYHYIGKEGLDWFLPDDDPYFDEIKAIAHKDYQYLPNADIVLFVKLNRENWTHFLQNRNRNMDNESLFQEQCFSLQEPMLDACKQYAEQYQKKLLIVEQTGEDLQSITQRTLKLLEDTCE